MRLGARSGKMRGMRLHALALASLICLAAAFSEVEEERAEARWIDDIDLATTLARRTGRPLLAQFR